MDTGAVSENAGHGSLSRCARENDEDNDVLGESDTIRAILNCDSQFNPLSMV